VLQSARAAAKPRSSRGTGDRRSAPPPRKILKSAPWLVRNGPAQSSRCHRELRHLDGQFIENLLFGCLYLPLMGGAAAVMQPIESIALLGREHELLPDGIDGMTSNLQSRSLFFNAQLKNIAPGARAQQFAAIHSSSELVAKAGPTFAQFHASFLDPAGGLFASSQSPGIALPGGVLGLFFQGADGLE